MKCRTQRSAPAGILGCLPVVLCLFLALPARAGVTVAILPETIEVAPGAEFDVSLVVTEPGSSFNAFGLNVGFDPAALLPIRIQPLTNQIGQGVTDLCGSQFHDFRMGAACDTINCSMLCGGVSMSGPGEVYRLRFRAPNSEQTTALVFTKNKFFNAGISIDPVTAHGATVRVLSSLAVGDAEPGARLAVRAGPNPVRGGAMVFVRTSRAARQSLEVLDVVGRVVRRLAGGDVPAGARQVWWDACGDSGTRVAPGVYQVIVRSGTEVAQTRVTVLR